MHLAPDSALLPFSELAFHQRLARSGTIIDVGANIGAFARPFSTWRTTRLIAFEPFPPIFQILSTALMTDHGGTLPPTTTLHMAALGAAPGSATLRVPRNAAGNIVHPMASMARNFEGMEGISAVEFEVPVWTIDGFGLEDLTAVKIDAEGYEIEILHGAQETIDRCRPSISCECMEAHRKGTTSYTPGFMRALGYDGWFHHAGQFWPVSALDRDTMQVTSAYGDPVSDPFIATFLFLPRERPDLRHRLAVFGSFRSE